MRIVALLLSFFLVLFAAEDYYEDDITPKEAYEMMQKGAVLIDVRTPAEYIYAGHTIGAISIPVFDYSYKAKAIDLRKNYAALEAKKQKALDAHKLYDITPVENKHFLDDAKKVIKPGKAILVICRTGARSKYAANILAKNGYENVYNVEGGFLAWKKAKLPYGGE